LLRRGKEVYYYAGKNECDFLVKEGMAVSEAIQVVYQMDAGNSDREYGGLTEAMQTYHIRHGLLITSNIDESSITPQAEIQVIPIWEWLLSPPAGITTLRG
jgi:hypothetical protein